MHGIIVPRYSWRIFSGPSGRLWSSPACTSNRTISRNHRICAKLADLLYFWFWCLIQSLRW
jgi:hypothetical protein